MEADEEHDHDLTFGGDRDSLASSSTSLASAITKYRFIKNRRYHSYEADKYSFPNDEDEVNRLDIEHHNQLLQSNGKLHICPLENPKEILDLGTGSGVWAIEMADLYPECQVIGTDLSPIQPVCILMLQALCDLRDPLTLSLFCTRPGCHQTAGLKSTILSRNGLPTHSWPSLYLRLTNAGLGARTAST